MRGKKFFQALFELRHVAAALDDRRARVFILQQGEEQMLDAHELVPAPLRFGESEAQGGLQLFIKRRSLELLLGLGDDLVVEFFPSAHARSLRTTTKSNTPVGGVQCGFFALATYFSSGFGAHGANAPKRYGVSRRTLEAAGEKRDILLRSPNFSPEANAIPTEVSCYPTR